ncbi:MAG: hypothetical protein AB1430_09890 [Pseudomonadota bacterium]
MKLPQPNPRTRSASKAPAAGDTDFANLWHPTVVEFTGGLEVTEVVDSIPAELLELFSPTQPGGKP